MARLIPLGDATVAVSGAGEPLHAAPDPFARAGRWKIWVLQRAGLTAPGVPTSPSPSAGTTTSSRRQRGDKNRFFAGGDDSDW